MVKSKRNWLKVCNTLWALLAAVLGFTGCDQIGTERCEYGMPTADYKIKGKVVDSQEKPVGDIQIIVKRVLGDNPDHHYSWDTLTTDKQGEFLFEKSETSEHKFRIDYQDIKNGIFKHDSTDVVMPNPTGGKGWYEGQSYKEKTIILEEIDAEDGE